MKIKKEKKPPKVSVRFYFKKDVEPDYMNYGSEGFELYYPIYLNISYKRRPYNIKSCFHKFNQYYNDITGSYPGDTPHTGDFDRILFSDENEKILEFVNDSDQFIFSSKASDLVNYLMLEKMHILSFFQEYIEKDVDKITSFSMNYNYSVKFVLSDFIDKRLMEEIYSELVKYFGKFPQLKFGNGFETFFMEIIEFVKIVDVVHQNSTSKIEIIRKLEFINESRQLIEKQLNNIVGFKFAAVTDHMFYYRNMFESIQNNFSQSSIDSKLKDDAISILSLLHSKIDSEINFEYYHSQIPENPDTVL